MRPTVPFTRLSIGWLISIWLVAATAYIWIAVDTVSSLRSQNALDQNTAAARIGARLLNEQWTDLLVVLDELKTHSPIQQDLRTRNTRALQADIKYAVDLVPALVLGAVYDANGNQICTYPESKAAPTHAAETGWFAGVKRQHGIYVGDSLRIRLPGVPLTEIIDVAIPLGDNRSPDGYLLIGYRVGDVDKWLRDLGIQGSELFIINQRGKVVDASTGADRSRSFLGLESFKRASARQEGSRISQHMYPNATADVGYAFAASPGWAVIVSRPETIALAPTRTIAVRLATLSATLLFLLAIAAAYIVRLYQIQHKMAAALVNQNENLRESDKLKSDFLANVSHDLRTPLASLQVSISSLLDPTITQDTGAVQETLRYAGESLEHISSRVRNLLEMSRIEARAWPVNLQVCDLTDIVGSALERMKALCAARVMELEFPNEPLLLECDPEQIESVVVNLLENALKYSPASTALSLRGGRVSSSVTFSIFDAGPGVPEDDQGHIFDKFYRSKAQSPVGGTGLGLAICRSIIEAHDGSIGVENTKLDGRITGAQFWFELPGLSESESGAQDERR